MQRLLAQLLCRRSIGAQGCGLRVAAFTGIPSRKGKTPWRPDSTKTVGFFSSLRLELALYITGHGQQWPAVFFIHDGWFSFLLQREAGRQRAAFIRLVQAGANANWRQQRRPKFGGQLGSIIRA